MDRNMSRPLSYSVRAEERQWNDYVVATILTLVLIFGLAGNLLVVCCIKNQPRLLRSNYYYLVQILAVCDIFHLLTGLRINYENWSPKWLFTSTVACKIWCYLEMFSCTSGIQIMIIICVFRYRAILKPLNPPVSRKKLRFIPPILFGILTIYLIPYILSYKFSPLKGCHMEWSNNTFRLIYTFFSINIHYILPVTIMSVLYFKICKALIQQTRKMDSYDGQQSLIEAHKHSQRVRHHRNKRTFIVSAVSVGIFAVAVLPFEIWWISDANDFGWFTNIYTRSLFYVSYIMGSSSVNPLIYGVLDQKLVEGFKRCFQKTKRVAVVASGQIMLKMNGAKSLHDTTTKEEVTLETWK